MCIESIFKRERRKKNLDEGAIVYSNCEKRELKIDVFELKRVLGISKHPKDPENIVS